MPKKVVILGAGLTGLSCAYYLGKDFDYEVYEKEERVGGLCRSVKQNGFVFDYTGHLLHFQSTNTKKLLFHLLKDNLKQHERRSWIYSKKVYTRYPFQANTYGLPIKIIKECVLGFVQAQIEKQTPRQKPSSNFYDWVLEHFGYGLAKHFMFPYNQKLWLTDLKNITCDWLLNFIPVPTLKQVLQGALQKQNENIGYNACFWYPQKGGIQVLPDALSKYIKNLHLSAEAVKINLSKKEIEFKNGQKSNFDLIISTIPLPVLVGIIENATVKLRMAARNLRYISVLNINLGIKRTNICDKHWVYFPEKEFIFYRVGFPTNFSSYLAPSPASSCYIEIAYKDGQINVNDKKQIEKITQKAISHLQKAKILKKNDKILVKNILDLKYAYVVYDFKRRQNLDLIQNYLQKNNIYSIGRYGAWKYSTMVEALAEGQQMAQYLKGTC